MSQEAVLKDIMIEEEEETTENTKSESDKTCNQAWKEVVKKTDQILRKVKAKKGLKIVK